MRKATRVSNSGKRKIERLVKYGYRPKKRKIFQS